MFYSLLVLNESVLYDCIRNEYKNSYVCAFDIFLTVCIVFIIVIYDEIHVWIGCQNKNGYKNRNVCAYILFYTGLIDSIFSLVRVDGYAYSGNVNV